MKLFENTNGNCFKINEMDLNTYGEFADVNKVLKMRGKEFMLNDEFRSGMKIFPFGERGKIVQVCPSCGDMIVRFNSKPKEAYLLKRGTLIKVF